MGPQSSIWLAGCPNSKKEQTVLMGHPSRKPVSAEHGQVKVRRFFKDMKPFILLFLYISSTILDRNINGSGRWSIHAPQINEIVISVKLKVNYCLSSVVDLVKDTILWEIRKLPFAYCSVNKSAICIQFSKLKTYCIFFIISVFTYIMIIYTL